MSKELPTFKDIDPLARLKIITIEEPKDGHITVQAQFNPKEVSLDTQVPWTKQKKKGPADLEYTGGEPRGMSFELLFDAFETGGGVQEAIANLLKLTEMMDKDKADKKRPPKVKVIWGPQKETVSLPQFNGVVENVSVKYTMFSASGEILRATATVKLKEANDLKVGKPQS